MQPWTWLEPWPWAVGVPERAVRGTAYGPSSFWERGLEAEVEAEVEAEEEAEEEVEHPELGVCLGGLKNCVPEAHIFHEA